MVEVATNTAENEDDYSSTMDDAERLLTELMWLNRHARMVFNCHRLNRFQFP